MEIKPENLAHRALLGLWKLQPHFRRSFLGPPGDGIHDRTLRRFPGLASHRGPSVQPHLLLSSVL